MFSKRASVVNEIVTDFKSHYEQQQTLEARESHAKFARAVDCLMKAADILDDVGLEAYADEIGSILEKCSWHVPTSDQATSGLTPEKMEKNLAEKGWVFNADDGEILEVVETSSDEVPELNDEDGSIEVEDDSNEDTNDGRLFPRKGNPADRGPERGKKTEKLRDLNHDSSEEQDSKNTKKEKSDEDEKG